MKERIFVCIASYRDKQLERTVRSVIENMILYKCLKLI